MFLLPSLFRQSLPKPFVLYLHHDPTAPSVSSCLFVLVRSGIRIVKREKSNGPSGWTLSTNCIRHGGGLGGKPVANSSNRNGNDDDSGEDLDGGAFCTCATFVGRTLFLGEGLGDDRTHELSSRWGVRQRP